MKIRTGTVVVLNATHEPFTVVDIPQAFRMLARKVAYVVDSDDERSFGGTVVPKVIALVKYVYKAWLDRPAKWHRGGIFIRDNHRCAYCNAKATTIDHIVPRSRGGRWSWTNCVAACEDCNFFKADRTPQEAGMSLRYAKPYVPTARQLGKK